MLMYEPLQYFAHASLWAAKILPKPFSATNFCAAASAAL